MSNGAPIAWENTYVKGKAIIFGSFVGQENYEHPIPMHPLAGILSRWAGLSQPNLRAPALLELREMQSAKDRWVFFFNHSEKAATVEFSRELEKPASNVREIITQQNINIVGTHFSVKTEVPPESVRVYRIDY